MAPGLGDNVFNTRQAGMICVGPFLVDAVEYADGRVRLHPGGNALITSVAAASLGLPVAAVGQIGDDPHAQRITARLEAAGVDVTSLRARTGHPTKVAELRVEPNGEWRWMRSTPRRYPYLACEQLSPLRHPGSHLHVAGLPPLLRAAPDAAKAMLDWRAAGGTVSAGLARFDADERARIRRALAPCELVFANAGELSALAGRACATPDDVKSVLRRGDPARALVTCGAQGAVLRWEDRIEHVSAPTRAARSTVGAGDLVAGAFLAACWAGVAIDEALQLSVDVGSASVEAETWDACLDPALCLDGHAARRWARISGFPRPATHSRATRSVDSE